MSIKVNAVALRYTKGGSERTQGCKNKIRHAEADANKPHRTEPRRDRKVLCCFRFRRSPRYRAALSERVPCIVLHLHKQIWLFVFPGQRIYSGYRGLGKAFAGLKKKKKKEAGKEKQQIRGELRFLPDNSGKQEVNIYRVSIWQKSLNEQNMLARADDAAYMMESLK